MIRINITVLFIGCLVIGALFSFRLQDVPKSPKVKPEEAYIPPGFIETKDIVYFDIDDQGSKGAVEKVISDYNKHIVGKVAGHTKQATAKEEILDKEGKPLDWDLRMDIIHPKTPSKPRPVFFIVATQKDRNIPRHTPFQQIFAKRGYVTVIIDHAWSPIDRAFSDNSAKYTLESVTGVKAYTAAVRYLRANAKKYSIDPDRIGGLGHSKGSYAISRLSDPLINHESSERRGKIEPVGPQPNTQYPSHIQVGYQSMGNGTRSSRTYVKDSYAPTITAVGKYDSYNHWAVWPDVVAAYSLDRDANWLGIPMLDRGHDMSVGFQHDLGYIREEVVEKFFSNYLEPKLPPNVLYVAPYNGRNNENIIKSNHPVAVHFSPQMDVASVKNAIKVIEEDTKRQVPGSWKASRKNTYFEFIPSSSNGFDKNKVYKVIIGTGAKSIHHIALSKSHEHTFTCKTDD